MNRRNFIKNLGNIFGGTMISGYLLDNNLFSATTLQTNFRANVYVAKNGTPVENITKVIDMRFGGIEHLIGHDDAVIINPNGQWPNQGGSNCACCMGLIDLILNRPGGFNGEIIFTECTQFQPDGYWTATGPGLDRNGPYNFNDMITYYHDNGHQNVSGVRICRKEDEPMNSPNKTGPHEGQGWVRLEWISPTNQLFGFPYPVIRSPYSNKLIDLKNGVYDNGYGDQPRIKFLKVPNLNNHGYNTQQDYAGITSAVKSLLGICAVGEWPGHKTLHAYGLSAYATGEAIGAFMNLVRKPDLFLTTAEWVGWGSRTGGDATQTRTVGLCEDPVSLDYYMSKYVLWPTCVEQQYFNPDYDILNNNTRQTLNGCHSQGFGTVTESEIAPFVYDFDSPTTFRFDIDRMITRFREGEASEQEVLELIRKYNEEQ